MELADSGPAQHPGVASEMLDFLRSYSREQLDSWRMDERRGFPLSLIPDLASAGLFGLQVPEAHAGQGLSHADALRVFRQVGAIDCNLMVFLAVHNTLGVPPIQHFAQPEVRDAVLPEIARGRRLVTSAITEPGTGSHVRAISTRASKLPDGSYVLNGDKQWISLGADADHVNVFARLVGEDGEDAGITGFLVDSRTPGFVRGSEMMTMGLKAVPQNRLTFENLRVPGEALLGAEGEGLTAAKTAFMRGRLALPTGAMGAAMRALELAQRFARRREVATGNLADNGRIQQILADSVAAIQAVDTLVRYIADRLDTGEKLPELWLFVAKILGCELMWKVVDDCVQLLGARGFVDTNVVAQFYRDYRLFRIFEGTTEAITVYLGSMIMKDSQRLVGVFDELEADPAIAEHAARVAKLTTVPTHGEQHKHVLAAKIGELACWSLLSALTAQSGHRSTVHARTAGWCEQRFLELLRQAEDTVPVADLPTGDEIARCIDGFEELIGNVEQRRPGDYRDLDLLLRRG
jgi:alkylation response protein AidB-like acyl-CoA dehydrogenase